MTPKTTPRTFQDRFVAGAIGTFAFVLLDASIGATFGFGRVVGGERTAYVAQILAAHAAALGLLLGLVVAAIGAVFEGRVVDLRIARPSYATLLYALVATALFEALNWTLFDGGGFARLPYATAVETAFRMAGLIVPPAVVLLLARALDGRRRRLFGFATLMIAAATLATSARVYRSQYPALHLQAALGAWAFCVLSADGLLRGSVLDLGRTRARAALVAGVAVALLFGHRLASEHRTFASVEPAVFERAHALGGVARLSRPLLRALRATTPEDSGPAREADAILERLFAKDDDATLARLDRLVPNRRDLSVLVVAVDTLRADRCGFLGFRTRDGRSPTPILDAFANEAVVFERAYTSYPTSAYAYDGLFSSKIARSTKVYAEYARTGALDSAPDRTLAEILKARGRRTLAVSAFNRVDVASPRRFKHVFDGFDLVNPDPFEEAADAGRVAASATAALTKIASDRRVPFLMWTHFLDPHAPYLDRANGAFGSTPHDWYLSEIAEADRGVGEVLNALKRLSRYDDTIIVVLSDHGEEFGERGGREHDGGVYDEQTRVPLLIRVPGVAPRRATSTVSLLDVAPTLFRTLGVDDPRRRDGRSLLRHLLGGEDPDGGFAYVEQFRLDGFFRGEQRRATILGRTKLVHRTHQDAYELFDLDADRGETRSLVGVSPDEPLLRALAAAYEHRAAGGDDAAVDPASAAVDEADRRFEALIEANDAARAATDKEAALEAGAEARRRADAFRRVLADAYGNFRPIWTTEALSSALTERLDRLAALTPTLVDGPASSAIELLSFRSSKTDLDLFRAEIRPFLEGDAARVRASAAEAALALAAAGDASAAPLLRFLYDLDLNPNKAPYATALAAGGDLRGLRWYLTTLGSATYGRTYRDAILALPKVRAHLPPELDVPPPSRLVRDRLVEETRRDPAIELAYVAALSAFDDEDADTLLLRFTVGGSETVRKAALEAARARPRLARDLDVALASADDELTADGMALNLAWTEAATIYRRALARRPAFNAGLRLRLARALAASGAVDAARRELDVVAHKAPLEIDRRLAERRKLFVERPLMQTPAGFSCVATKVERPPREMPEQHFGAFVRLRNDGADPWFGGFHLNAPDVAIRFLDAEGRILEPEEAAIVQNRLPEQGVLPGEEIDLFLLGFRPKTERGARFAIVFKNERLAYDDSGVVHAEPADGAAASRPKGGG